MGLITRPHPPPSTMHRQAKRVPPAVSTKPHRHSVSLSQSSLYFDQKLSILPLGFRLLNSLNLYLLTTTWELGSIGAPTGNLRVATSGTTSAGTDSLFPGSGNAPGLSGQPAPPVMAGPGVPNPAPSSAAQNPQHFESPRRAQSYRQGDELHIPSMSQHGSHQQPISGQQMYHSPQEYSTGGVPGINLQQATSQGAQYSNASSGSTLPSTLQPGGLSSGRPGALSTNTAPPTMHQLATQQQQQYPPSRSGTFNNHSHSRSSPSGFDNQKYVSTPSSLDSPKYMPHKYTAFHGQQSPAPNSAPAGAPLGLADIRPRTDTGTSDPGANLNPYSYDGNPALPTNSNYLAPWAIYAFDWCKWPVQQQAAGAGKVAVGSYLEDGHNFVGSPWAFKRHQNPYLES
jgi:WD repeat-containing protein 68